MAGTKSADESVKREFADRLSRRRIELGLSPAALAKALGCKPGDLIPQLAERRPMIGDTLETSRVPGSPNRMRLVINGIFPTDRVLKVLAILENVESGD